MAPPGARLVALAMQNVIILLCLIARRRLRRRRRRLGRPYARYLLTKRRELGTYRIMVPDQRIFDHKSHHESFRMSPQKLQLLLEKVGPRIWHHPTHRDPIDAGERLTATLK